MDSDLFIAQFECLCGAWDSLFSGLCSLRAAESECFRLLRSQSRLLLRQTMNFSSSILIRDFRPISSRFLRKHPLERDTQRERESLWENGPCESARTISCKGMSLDGCITQHISSENLKLISHFYSSPICISLPVSLWSLGGIFFEFFRHLLEGCSLIRWAVDGLGAVWRGPGGVFWGWLYLFVVRSRQALQLSIVSQRLSLWHFQLPEKFRESFPTGASIEEYKRLQHWLSHSFSQPSNHAAILVA